PCPFPPPFPTRRSSDLFFPQTRQANAQVHRRGGLARAAFLVGQRDHAAIPGAASLFRHFHVLLLHRFSRPLAGRTAMYAENPKEDRKSTRLNSSHVSIS